MKYIEKHFLGALPKGWNVALHRGAFRELQLYKTILVQTDFWNDSSLSGQRSAVSQI